jgi:hypothetical protein
MWGEPTEGGNQTEEGSLERLEGNGFWRLSWRVVAVGEVWAGRERRSSNPRVFGGLPVVRLPSRFKVPATLIEQVLGSLGAAAG